MAEWRLTHDIPIKNDVRPAAKSMIPGQSIMASLAKTVPSASIPRTKRAAKVALIPEIGKLIQKIQRLIC
jgi:hypothetical protein